MDAKRCAGLLLLLALPTLWLGQRQLALEVDIENLAMKSIGTAEAQAMQRRLAEFGDEHTVIVLYEPIGAAATVCEQDRPTGLVPELRKLPGVKNVREIPRPAEDAFVYAIDIGAAADGTYAERVRAVAVCAERASPPLLRVAVTGQPLGEIAIAEAVAAERRLVLPLIGGVLAAILWIGYRRVSLVLAILAPALAGIAWTGGLFALLGYRIDPVSALQDPVLLTVGVAAAVHLVEAWLRHRSRGQRPDRAAVACARELIRPTLLTAGTTVAGFSSLALASIPAVQRFGLTIAAGVVLTTVLTFAITPAWLCLFARGAAFARIRRPVGPSVSLSRAIALWTRDHARAITIVTVMLACLGSLGWARLGVDTDPIRLLPERHPFRVATDRVAKRLGGIETFDLILPARDPAPGMFRLLGLQAELSRLDGVVSLAGPPRQADSGARLVRLLLRPDGTSARERLFAASERLAASRGFPDAVATGPSVQVARDSGRFVRGQWNGMIATLCVIWLVMAIGLRSTWLGLLGLLPNALPCVLIYGGLAALGRPLSVASAMIGSVMLGLIVDNTIHLLHRFREQRARGESQLSAAAHTLHRTGRAILLGSLVLALGFGAGVFGALATTREFGVLAAITILLAMATNLTLVPAMMSYRRRTRRGALQELPHVAVAS